MSDETTAAQSPEKKPLHLKRNTLGGVIGNVLESVLLLRAPHGEELT